MTSRERLQAVLAGKIPDCVPVAPDTSNMIPARLTGKPFWQIYLYQDPPLWLAYLDCVKHFGFDSLMDGYFPLTLPEEADPDAPAWEPMIVYETPERLVVQHRRREGRRVAWSSRVDVYYVADPPTGGVPPEKIGLPPVPRRWRPVEGVKQWPTGVDLLRLVKQEMGDHGLVGVWCGTTLLTGNPEALYSYYDDPAPWRRRAVELLEHFEARFHRLLRLPERLDFLCLGASGTLVFGTVPMFRELALPIVQRITELAAAAGLPTHIHSCGPERELVRICAEETQLSVIDPLEPPPMGDCDLAHLKRRYGHRLTLKGNLHTTEVMLRGTPETVAAASRQAIDAAAEGGRFILSTGDQCGRDTRDENILAMIATARDYGHY